MKSQEKSKKKLYIVIALVCFVVFAVVNAFVQGSKPSDTSNSQTDNQEKSLNISAGRSAEGIVLSTEIGSDLKGCKVTINNKYSTDVDVIGNQSATIPYSVFTDNGERFDYSRTQPERLMVTSCDDRLSEYAEFDWKS